MNNTLEDTVVDVTHNFMSQGLLFTALDVSNEVKKIDPTVRHKEVRDCVRSVYQTHIESKGWTRTPIKVQLADGTSVDALLYHDLGSSWDLDNKYGAQQRTQTSLHNIVVSGAPSVNAIQVATTPALAPATKQSVVVPAVPPFATAKTMWDNLWQTLPSLFPVK